MKKQYDYDNFSYSEINDENKNQKQVLIDFLESINNEDLHITVIKKELNISTITLYLKKNIIKTSLIKFLER